MCLKLWLWDTVKKAQIHVSTIISELTFQEAICKCQRKKLQTMVLAFDQVEL